MGKKFPWPEEEPDGLKGWVGFFARWSLVFFLAAILAVAVTYGIVTSIMAA